ncbi:triggering receptor expressed on myeloid cells 2 (predicted), isoform CRA_d [Rattus norvegicus]|uniref:Triggering receptor expressed on myeloid cells 2 (Predicted), isoform CRA_d n=1 Tax=Rattus norvegicus TaxID=10116 RepID=A6JIF7_RAT|nr:triggering receptor expressed on myeloid cells 2 (predicted), isoform CRA_d [Rattus norvegicus]
MTKMLETSGSPRSQRVSKGPKWSTAPPGANQERPSPHPLPFFSSWPVSS